MKTSCSLFLLALFLASCATDRPTYELTDMKPIRVRFGQVRTVFERPDTPRGAVEGVKSFHLREGEEYVIDAVSSDKREETWCKREGKDTYSLPFVVRRVSLEKLQRLKGASLAQLEHLLGDFSMPSHDYEYGIGVSVWLICNGQRGDRFQAIEVVAGVKAPGEVLLLLIRTAQGE